MLRAGKLGMTAAAVSLAFAAIPASVAQGSEAAFQPQVVVAYSTPNGQVTPEVRVLDMLITHFTTHVILKNTSQITASDLQNATNLFYIGTVGQSLSASFRQAVTHFSGSVIGIGYNVSALGTRFSYLKESPQVVVNQINIARQNPVTFTLTGSILLHHIALQEPSTTLETASGKSKSYPLFVQHNSAYYFATSNLLTAKVFIALAEGLDTVFHAKQTSVHPAYLQLEDVSPAEDPVRLLSVGKYLYEQHIPYMISTIPVYVDPETHTVLRFDNRPKVLKALLWMQAHGASIVMEGYTHQYGNQITGLGADFWDQINNMPVIGPPNAAKKTRQDFTSTASYIKYLQQHIPYERTYMKTRLRKGVQELVTVGLYPVAFESPRYAISLEGYKWVAEDFSTYNGQAQLSDLNWHIMATSPYTSSPSFMDGMKFLPETIGYVEKNNPNAVSQMLQRAKLYATVNDGVIGGFYHPFLGVSRLRKLVQGMKKISGIQWINLKKMNNTVHVQGVSIQSGAHGVTVKANLYWTRYFWMAHLKALEHYSRWLIILLFPAVAVGSMVIRKLRKRRRPKHRKRNVKV